MPRIKHIALTTQDPAKAAAFYKEAFGLREIRRNPQRPGISDRRLHQPRDPQFQDREGRRCRRARRQFQRHPPFRLRGRRSRRRPPRSSNGRRQAADRQGRSRHGDGGRQPPQFRDEMAGSRRRRHRHLAHRLGQRNMIANITLCVGTVGSGAWISPDGGESWRRVERGLSGESRVYGLARASARAAHRLRRRRGRHLQQRRRRAELRASRLADEQDGRVEDRVRSDRARRRCSPAPVRPPCSAPTRWRAPLAAAAGRDGRGLPECRGAAGHRADRRSFGPPHRLGRGRSRRGAAQPRRRRNLVADCRRARRPRHPRCRGAQGGRRQDRADQHAARDLCPHR